MRCYAENYCKKNKQECSELCGGYRVLKALFTLSRIPVGYQYNIPLVPERGDLPKYEELNDFMKSVVEKVQAGEGLYIWSAGTGTGKTSWACKIMGYYFRKIAFKSGLENEGLYIFLPTFLEDLRDNYDNKDPEFLEELEMVKNCKLLIIDDIGAEKPSEWVRERLLSFINIRVSNGLSTIYTSNLSIENFYKAFPKIQQLRLKIEKTAEEYGYVSTVCGRKRRLPDMQLPDKDDYRYAEAHRQSLNSVIQGSSADIMKLSMIAIYNDPKYKELDCHMIITVHDELIMEVPEDHIKEGADLLVSTMKRVGHSLIDLPMSVDAEVNDYWYLDIQHIVEEMEGVECLDLEEMVKEAQAKGIKTEFVGWNEDHTEGRCKNDELSIYFQPDGVLRYKGKDIIFEIKTESTYQFNNRYEPKEDHKWQATCYGMGLGIDYVLFFYEDRNFCRKKAYLWKITEEMKQAVLNKINTVNTACKTGVPPEKNEDKCTYCKYKNECGLVDAGKWVHPNPPVKPKTAKKSPKKSSTGKSTTTKKKASKKAKEAVDNGKG